jgi:hypothetical protein
MLNSLHTDAASHPVRSLNSTARVTATRRQFNAYGRDPPAGKAKLTEAEIKG